MWELASEILDKDNPAEHNQAIMEFGALLCVPGLPICIDCPLSEKCEAYKSSSVESFPVKIKKSPVKERFFTYLIMKQDDYTYLNKRTGNDIWKQMFEFPLMEHSDLLKIENLEEELISFGHLRKKDYSIRTISEPIKHQLSHRTIYARFVHIEILNPLYAGLPNWTKVSLNAVSEFPLPRLIDRYIDTNSYL
jgi:A/G-specific adenine glycosylase